MVLASRMPPTQCGVAEYTSMLLNSLARLPGLRVSVFGGDAPGLELGARYRDPYSGVEVLHCFANGDVSYLPKCLAEVGKPGILHIQHEYGIFPDAEALVSLIKWMSGLGVKVVLTLHTVIHALGKARDLEAQKLLVSSSRAVIVHSVLQEQELFMQGFPEERVYRIPHGTLINPYIDTPKSKLLNDLPLPEAAEGKSIVTLIGFIRAKDKDYLSVVKAVEALSRRYDVMLVVSGKAQGREVGTVQLELELERLAREKSYILFLKGFLDRLTLLKLLAVSDVVVIPEVVREEERPIGTSGVFHLAIGSRKPVVCTRSHKLIECSLIASELTLHSLTVDELMQKLSEVLERSERVREAVERLWRYAKETIWDRVAEKHYKLYMELLEQ